MGGFLLHPIKSPLYKLGWAQTIAQLASLKTHWDRQIYSETAWYQAQKLMFDQLGTDFTQGVIDAIILFEKTGYLGS